MHITICAVGLQWHKMNRKLPEHPSSSLPITAAERSKVSTGYYLFACLVFSPHDINVFVTDLTVEYAMTHVQRFSSGILIIFLRNCVRYEGILINVWLLCMVKVQHSVRYTIVSDLHLHKMSKFI